MKINLLTLIAIIAFASCTHHESLYKKENVDRIIANCTTSEEFQVPVKEGYTTIVTYGEDTLAVANEPITILVPRSSQLQSKSDAATGIKIDYAIIKSIETYSQCWQAVMFEDSKKVDYDYNDLIIHVYHSCNYSKTSQTIEIQPIALGSEKTIALGCILADGSKHMITNDARKDLFNGAEGYINTLNDKEPIKYKLSQKLTCHFEPAIVLPTIAWFIEVEGKRFFAISGDNKYANYDQMLTDDGLPYGLVIYSGAEGKANGTFVYPQEKTSIFEAYPDFKEWVNGKKDNVGACDKSLCYRYSYRPGSVYIWDYEREKNVPLYD